MAKLLSYPSIVETPFIIVKIAGYTFGSYKTNGDTLTGKVTYPNFMDSITIVKINGQLNTYSISMRFQIAPGDDPNMLDAIFSSNKAKNGYQKITISYGDFATPSYTFKDEEAIMTRVQSRIDFGNSSITYTISCTSTKLAAVSNVYNFPATKIKVSDLLVNMVCNKSYGLSTVFTGMSSRNKILSSGMIASDDREVQLEAKTNISLLNYMRYAVSCMASVNDAPDKVIKSCKYMLNIEDDNEGKYGGPYFRVVKVVANDRTTYSDDDIYTIDIGYPGDNYVMSFNVNNNDIWSIFYNYSKELHQTNYMYKIDNEGHLVQQYSPAISTSKDYGYTTESDKTWWTNMTEFPITATLQIKGLLRPSILMDKVRLNVNFYGASHITSGIYIIIKQVDTVNSSGYKTELTLTRVSPVDNGFESSSGKFGISGGFENNGGKFSRVDVNGYESTSGKY